jgi:molybdopterin molybdotransferase
MEHDPPQRIAALTPLGEVLAGVDRMVKPVAASRVDLVAAFGCILAEDVVARASIPAAALALRDGWAVPSDLTTDAGAYAPAPVPSAAPIEVGEPLPPACDAVAPFDAVKGRNGAGEALAPVGPGEGVLPAGGDVAAGSLLLAAGRRLRATHISVLAVAGVGRVTVRVPRLRLVAARAEDTVIEAALAVVAGDIAAACGRPQHPDAGFDDALQAKGTDAVVVFGGTGSGRNDTSVVALARLGRLDVHGIALAPGETAAFGFVASRPVLLLPGRLDAAMAAWLVLGRRLLARLSGDAEEEPATRARLRRKVASSLGLAEWVPVRMREGAAEPIASGYVPLAALAQADGWILVPAESEGYPPGAEVMVRPWP